VNRTRLLALLPLLALAGPAHADDDNGLRIGNPQPAVALGLGATTALSGIATGAGVHLDALTRLLPETLLGVEADAMMVGVTDPELPQAAGRLIRGGLLLRQSVMGWGPLKFGGELAAVLGLGWERIEWNRGGRLTRTEFSFGLEDCLVVNRDRYGSLAFGVRGIYARDTGGWDGGIMLGVTVRGSP
jgi:hypothetical protein